MGVRALAFIGGPDEVIDVHGIIGGKFLEQVLSSEIQRFTARRVRCTHLVGLHEERIRNVLDEHWT